MAASASLDVKQVADDGPVKVIGQTLSFYDGEAFMGCPTAKW